MKDEGEGVALRAQPLAGVLHDVCAFKFKTAKMKTLESRPQKPAAARPKSLDCRLKPAFFLVVRNCFAV